MKDTIINLFEDNSTGVAIIATIFIVALYIGFAIGFYALAVWLASKCFGFAFKWVYVFALWIGCIIARSIFQAKVKVES